MRNITTHKVNDYSQTVDITASDRDPSSNTSREYTLGAADGGPTYCTIKFQDGQTAEVGPNGITIESLIAIALDQLEGHQAGPFPCVENERAMHFLVCARAQLEARTESRRAREVEGTHVA